MKRIIAIAILTISIAAAVRSQDHEAMRIKSFPTTITHNVQEMETSVDYDSTMRIEVYWRPPEPWEPRLRYNVYVNPLNGTGYVINLADTSKMFDGWALKDTVMFKVTAVDSVGNESPPGRQVWANYVTLPPEPVQFETLVWDFKELIEWKPSGPVALNVDQYPHENGLYLWGNIGQGPVSIHTYFKATEPGDYQIRLEGNGGMAIVVIDGKSYPREMSESPVSVFVDLEIGKYQIMIWTEEKVWLTGERAVEIRKAMPDMDPPESPDTGIRVIK